MKKRLNVLKGMLVCVAVLIIGTTCCAERLGAGKAQWTGGENSRGMVYSKIRDAKKDNYRNYGTVWVRNDKGQSNHLTGHTTGLNTTIYTEIKATHKNPFVAEKAWYIDYWTQQRRGE